MKSAFGVGLAVLALAVPRAGALAQARCDPEPLAAGRSWATPLDRTISLHEGTVPLKHALSLITTAAQLRLSYSRDLVPVDRLTCLEFSAAPVGEVLERILRGTAVAAVVTGREHVVLATDHAPRASLGESALREPIVLDGIIVEAAAGHPGNGAGVTATEVDGRTLELLGADNLAAALDAVVPGVWLWASGAGGTIAQYGSLRGASSFGLSAPKLYIDGLEVANPLLISTIDPATVERVEIIRGPQAAARFGGDALAGVTHIITRQGAVDASGSHATLRTGVGVAGSAFSSSDALEQDHGLAVSTGRPDRSARLDLAFASLGDYVPGSASRSVSAVGAARTIGERFALSATARFLSESASLSESPLLQATSAALEPGTHRDIALSQYTAGLTGTYRADHWTHTLVAGVNGYALGGAPTFAEAGNAADSALAGAGTSAWRTTLRLTSSAHVRLNRDRDFGITFAVEHSGLHQAGGSPVAIWSAPYTHSTSGSWLRPALQPTPTPAEEPPGEPPQPAAADAGTAGRERSSTGISSRIDLGLGNLDLSAGLRLQQTTLENRANLSVMLPSLGASWQVLETDRVALAIRAAYGKAVRWPEVGATTGFLRTLLLTPEVQTGTEAGIDLELGRSLSLHATRFDQVATGLSQQVAVPRDGTPWNPPGTVLVAQNVGAIDNRGWEFTAATRRGPLALSSTLSLVDSRVRSLADCYTGDLAAGDRLLGVPARTASINALWTQPHWSAALSLARAFDWVNYDRIAIARAEAAGVPLTTAQLRNYWLDHSGSTRLRASFSRDLASRFTLRLTGDNLLDFQTGEPDNATIVPGRTISFSVRARL